MNKPNTEVTTDEVSVRHREKAAQAWCTEATKNTVMDTVLADAFAKILSEETAKLRHYGEWAWAIIANAGGGDWNKETQEWQQAAQAAAKWRDEFHAIDRPRESA